MELLGANIFVTTFEEEFIYFKILQSHPSPGYLMVALLHFQRQHLLLQINSLKLGSYFVDPTFCSRGSFVFTRVIIQCFVLRRTFVWQESKPMNDWSRRSCPNRARQVCRLLMAIWLCKFGSLTDNWLPVMDMPVKRVGYCYIRKCVVI